MKSSIYVDFNYFVSIKRTFLPTVEIGTEAYAVCSVTPLRLTVIINQEITYLLT